MIIPNQNNKADYTKCRNEQEFKMTFIKSAKNKNDFYTFCIETEETVKGFPDVLCIEKKTNMASFEEFKYTKTGKITFQPSQPAFYLSHPSLEVMIIAYNAQTDTIHGFTKHELFDEDSPYHMNAKAEVDLRRAE